MYPRNAATPPKIAIGPVVQISDGAVQTSGVSVVVCPEGGTESAGGGTITYGSISGIVYYAPTQAETNYTAFAVAAYKTGCIPASVTVVTTASATAGHIVPADDSITAAKFDESTAFPLASADSGATAVARVGADGDTLETLGDQLDAVKTDTAAILADTGADGVVVASGSKTGYALTAAYDAAKTAAQAGVCTETRLANLDATVSSRLAAAGYTAPDNANIAAIVADTNELRTDLVNGGRLDLLLDGIKAKTDLIPASPAATGDVPTAADVKTALEAAGSSLAQILEDTGTTLPAAIAGIEAGTGGDATAANQAAILTALSTLRGEDDDTLKTLSEQIDGVASATPVNITVETSAV